MVREAAACALPALLVRGSCAAEGIDDGQTGLLMDENAQSLCAQALWACAHPDEIHRIGQTAQERIYISWEDAVRPAEKRYADILAAVSYTHLAGNAVSAASLSCIICR